MAEIDELVSFRSDCIPDTAAGALADLRVELVDESSMMATIARLKFSGPPSYLPIATVDGEIIAVHLLPSRDVRLSPFVCFASGSRMPEFMCSELSGFARALWIWLAAYYKNRVMELRGPIEALVCEIPGAAAIPDGFWTLLAEAPLGQPQRWNYRAQKPTVDAWKLADVGHPFVDLSDLSREDAHLAVIELKNFLGSHDEPAPQVLSALIDASHAATEPVPARTPYRVLCEEAWLGGEAVFRTLWSTVERGLGEWSKALRAAIEVPDSIDGTPFAALADYPKIYSGADVGAPKILENVADAFTLAGDPRTGLNQLRNAAFVALDGRGGYGSDLCAKIADTCELIEHASAAASLANAAGSSAMRDL